jgi:hypothetical protein
MNKLKDKNPIKRPRPIETSQSPINDKENDLQERTFFAPFIESRAENMLEMR